MSRTRKYNKRAHIKLEDYRSIYMKGYNAGLKAGKVNANGRPIIRKVKHPKKQNTRLSLRQVIWGRNF